MVNRDRGTSRDATPPTPPGIRVRTTAVRRIKHPLASPLEAVRDDGNGFGEAAVQGFRKTQPPRSLWAEDGRTGRAFRNVEATQFTVALAARLPLDPDDATQTSSDPAV